MAIKIIAADTWFSKCVRERAGWKCERCGAQHQQNSMGLHCAHFMSRGKWGTRFEPFNAAALCYGCHSYLDSHPYEKAAWFENHFGLPIVGIVREKAEFTKHGLKKMQKEISKHYRDFYRWMAEQRNSGVAGRIEIEGFA